MMTIGDMMMIIGWTFSTVFIILGIIWGAVCVNDWWTILKIRQEDLSTVKDEVEMLRRKLKQETDRNKELQERIEYLIKNEVRL